jgi:hypothetical protein
MIKLLKILVIGALSASLALPAPVTFHLIDINEVYTNADGTLQYVELIANQNFQTNLAPVQITSLNADGAKETLVFDFTASFPGLGRNETLLLATQSFESVAGFPPDFVIPDGSILLVNGRVIYKQDSGSIIDAVAYGAFTGSNSGFGNPAPALPGDGVNSLTRVRTSNTKNNATDFASALNSPKRNDGTSATIRGGGFMLALLSDTDEIIRFELATGNIVQRAPAGFDVKNSSGIDIGTASGVNNGNPFVVVTQLGERFVRLYDAVTLQSMGRFALGPNDIGWGDVAFDGTNWIFSVPDGVVGDPTVRGMDLINLSASVASGNTVKFGSINLHSSDMPVSDLGAIGVLRPGVIVVSGCTDSCQGGGDRSLIQILINNNQLMRGSAVKLAGSGGKPPEPGVSGQLVSVNAGHILISVPGSGDLSLVDLRTGQRAGTLTIKGLNFTGDIAPDNAISGLSRETNISGPR